MCVCMTKHFLYYVCLCVYTKVNIYTFISTEYIIITIKLF